MSYKDLLELTADDLRHMTADDIENVARGLVSVANTRITQLMNDDRYKFSPAVERRQKSAYGERMEEYRAKKKEYKKALKDAKETGARKPRKPVKPKKSKISPKFQISKDRNKNIELIKKTKAFLNAETSTKKGMDKILKDFNDKINKGVKEEYRTELNQTQERRFWRLYNKVAESGGVNKRSSEQIQKFIATLVKGSKGYVKNQSILDLATDLKDKLYTTNEMKDVAETPSATFVSDEDMTEEKDAF